MRRNEGEKKTYSLCPISAITSSLVVWAKVKLFLIWSESVLNSVCKSSSLSRKPANQQNQTKVKQQAKISLTIASIFMQQSCPFSFGYSNHNNGVRVSVCLLWTSVEFLSCPFRRAKSLKRLSIYNIRSLQAFTRDALVNVTWMATHSQNLFTRSNKWKYK